MENRNFFTDAQEVAKLIPYGRVTSYGAIAKYLGSPRSARMVGWAMNASKYNLENIPAHRVVNSKGILTGKNHFADENSMEKLLMEEGIEVKNGQILNFKQVFWDPLTELL